MSYREMKFDTQAAADAFSALINKAAGLPSDGRKHGSGRHVPTEQGRTLRVSEIVQDGGKYIYKVTAEVEKYNEARVTDNGVVSTIDLSSATTVKVPARGTKPSEQPAPVRYKDGKP